MVTPHLPPEQSANALLPVMLGAELRTHGIESRFVTHPPAAHASGAPSLRTAPDVVYVPRRGRSGFSRTIGGAVLAGARMAMRARQSVRASDLVHLHSNGFIIEIAAELARRNRKPAILTLYGTDIWHYDASRHARFGRVVAGAVHRVFYSRGLLEFARGLGLAPEPSRVIYAPVPTGFEDMGQAEREAFRRSEGVEEGPLLLTVKRLHPVAGYEDLLRAAPTILERYPQARFWIIGEGEERPALERLARERGVAARVSFLGLRDNASLRRYYAAADLFVLPSRLESWGAVMLEALACGTPVVATDTVGGVEVHEHFPQDVVLVKREDPGALAAAVGQTLERRKRTSEATRIKLREQFSVEACARQYLRLYEDALGKS